MRNNFVERKISMEGKALKKHSCLDIKKSCIPRLVTET